MDLRPQGHDIIRTWLFYSLARAHVEHGTLPWGHALISGWVLDPARRKLAKSRGRAPTLEEALDRFGADALRWWAASKRPGLDTAFDEGQLRVGRRLATKLLNAARFVGAVPGARQRERDGAAGEQVTEPLDRAMLARLASVVEEATAAFAAFDAARALDAVEGFFWSFCDDYLELVKARAYGEADPEGQASAAGALRLALGVLLRLFAPVLPFAAEEAWSWRPPAEAGRRPGGQRAPAGPDSVHRAPWPDPAELRAAAGAPAGALEAAGAVLAEVRKAKTLAKRSLRTPVARVVVRDRPERLAVLAQVADDVCRAGRIAELALGDPAEERSVEVGLD
jgi:valyl-tRNA synthetase